MTSSAGKTIALIFLVVLILFVGLRLTPFFIAPFGVFTGMIEGLRSGGHAFHISPFSLRWTSLSLFSFALLVLWIIVIVWVYRDAERRGMNGVVWALLVLIGNLIGLLIYLIVRTDSVPAPPVQRISPAATLCPSCQKSVGADFAFCPHCGTQLQRTCPQCGKSVEPAWKACPHCGAKLDEE